MLEVGSYDVNGSIRAVVRESPIGQQLNEYVGIDLVEGPGVDVVASGHEFTYPDNHFDLVMSLECFEHNPYWRETLTNMVRMLKPGGWCIVTCASLGRPEHGTARMEAASSPGTTDKGWNYYRNVSLPEFRTACRMPESLELQTLRYGPVWNDLFFVARKQGNAANLETSIELGEKWEAATHTTERASLKRRATYVLERVLGSRAFQWIYVALWRSVKPAPR